MFKDQIPPAFNTLWYWDGNRQEGQGPQMEK